MKVRTLGIMAILCCLVTERVSAQSQEMQQLILNVEKLAQFKSILEDMKKGYEILAKGYEAVKNVSEGNFSLHKVFLDGLLEVSPAVKKYKRVADIVDYQVKLVAEYKRALRQFRISEMFDSKELDYIDRVYKQLFDQSLACLDDLASVLTAGRLRMNDEERINEIDNLYYAMQDKVSFLRSFNNSTAILAMQRLKEKINVDVVRKHHGMK